MLRRSLCLLSKGTCGPARQLEDNSIHFLPSAPFQQFLCQLGASLSTTPSCCKEDLKDAVIVIPMPQLSPHMKSGTVSKWLKKPGEEISVYDVVLEVDTETLSEEAYKIGDFAGSVTMLVEAQEEGFLSKILVEEGKEVKVNEPVAIMCELEESLREIEDAKSAVDDLLRDHGNLRKLTWQSYLKEGSNEGKGCS